MNAQEQARIDWSINRLLRLQNSPEARRVAAKYGDLVYREATSMWFFVLAIACMLRASGKSSRVEFNAVITASAKQAGIPIKDMKTIARIQLAMTESALIGSGQLPLIVEGGAP